MVTLSRKKWLYIYAVVLLLVRHLFLCRWLSLSLVSPRVSRRASSSALLDHVPTECQEGREIPWRILEDAGVPNASLYCGGIASEEEGKDTLACNKEKSKTLPRLSLWNETTALYGPKPVILRYCNTRNKSLPFLVPRIAGMYNSGTNALKKFLQLNFVQVQRNLFKENATDRETQKLPWVRYNLDLESMKHTPVSLNTHNQDIPYLRVIITRDPYRWIQSTCQSNYGIQWSSQGKGLQHLPNCTYRFPPTVPSLSIEFATKYKPARYTTKTYTSLSDMWSDWHSEYLNHQSLNKGAPALVIRFEDMLFHTHEVLKVIADCAGMDLIGEEEETDKHKLIFPLSRSKTHGCGIDNFAATVAHTGNPRGRVGGFTDAYLNYTAHTLDPKLMKLFHYEQPVSTSRRPENVYAQERQ